VVPLEWADVPFELLLVDSAFLGQQYRIGTIISIEREHNPGVESLSDRQILIIADPARNLPSAFEEGAAINKLAVSKRKRARLLTDVDKEKLSASIGEASIVHFSGHSSITEDASLSGWKLKSDELYTPTDIAVSLAAGSKAGLVFSNSCEAAKIDKVAGIASEFLSAGVPQFVAPIIRVRDEAAKSIALRFYSCLFENRSVSQSLLTVRKEFVREEMTIAALSYRLFGDPCVAFFAPGKQETVATNSTTSKWNKRKLIAIGITVFIICIMLIVVLLGLTHDNVIYIPAK
jgi:CHAT domain-containing protein